MTSKRNPWVRRVGLGALVFLLFAELLAVSEQSLVLERQTGEEIVVTICKVSELSRVEMTGPLAEYQAGLRFLFLVEKVNPEEGRFGLREIKDFSVDGVSYDSISEGGTHSMTIVSDVEDRSTELSELGVELPNRRALVLDVRIAGRGFEVDKSIDIIASFAWGRELAGSVETFRFTVPKSRIRTKGDI